MKNEELKKLLEARKDRNVEQLEKNLEYLSVERRKAELEEVLVRS